MPLIAVGLISQRGRDELEMNVFDNLGEDTLETRLAATKIGWDNIRRKASSAESQKSLCTVQRQHSRWNYTVLAIHMALHFSPQQSGRRWRRCLCTF
jgi:hypothetical protein